MDGRFEFPAQFPRLLRRDACDEDALFVFQEAVGDFQNLIRCLARGEDDFGKTLAQRTMCVHLREAEVGEGRGLKGTQHLVPACLAGAKFLQQTDCFNGSHAPKIAQKPLAVTPESNGICGGHRLDTAVNKTPYSGKSRRASTGSSAGVRMASIFIFCRVRGKVQSNAVASAI
jgi:hypothetical protein